MSSPLLQFNIIELIPIKVGSLDLSITNATISIIMTLSIFVYLLPNLRKPNLKPNHYQMFVEGTYKFVKGTVLDILGNDKSKFLGYLLTLFNFICILNLIGMVPYAYAITSQAIITLFLSCAIWLGVLQLGLKIQKSYFFANFLPDKSPFVMAILLINIELISFIARAISLGVRLAANITSGHILLGIIAGFALNMLLIKSTIINIVGIIIVLLLIVLTLLELAVALIQAYVFTLLTSIYIQDVYSTH
jgi:ATP synthase subunit 6|uniref:ATP synthase subunit a n=1 Tax=Ministeria vibrans TaxID=134558 RepID=M1KFM2_MINVI|nr:ATP synthase F0 subunit 6 [Ministeria vibrans]AGE93710.1 ATP synthase F0 subunit a [Ministeria vibrans]